MSTSASPRWTLIFSKWRFPMLPSRAVNIYKICTQYVLVNYKVSQSSTEQFRGVEMTNSFSIIFDISRISKLKRGVIPPQNESEISANIHIYTASTKFHEILLTRYLISQNFYVLKGRNLICTSTQHALHNYKISRVSDDFALMNCFKSVFNFGQFGQSSEVSR